MLSTNGEEGRVGLQASLHQEERRSGRSTDDSGGGSSKDISSEGLDFRVAVDGSCDTGTDRLVETQTAAVEQDLVDVLDIPRVSLDGKHSLRNHTFETYGRSNSPKQASRAFILQNDLDAVQDALVLLDSLIFCLQFTLQL